MGLKKFFLLGCVAFCHCHGVVDIEKERVKSGTTQLMQAISFVDASTAWISGHGATFCKTTDRGLNWEVFDYPEMDSLQFRDLHAMSAEKVVLMSAGVGKNSNIFIYESGKGLRLTYAMSHPEGFLNSIAFWNDQQGLAFGDSFNGEYFILSTSDGGESWSRIDPAILPKAGEGEGGFAASGTCIDVQPDGLAWIGTGAGGTSHVLKTADYGSSWISVGHPLVTGEVAGITSIAMFNQNVGVIVGGDLMITDAYLDNMAITQNGGKDWSLTNQPVTKGAFYGNDIDKWDDELIWMATGPKGIDWSQDLGKTWMNLDTLNYWAVSLHPSGYGLAVGRDGMVLKIELKD